MLLGFELLQWSTLVVPISDSLQIPTKILLVSS